MVGIVVISCCWEEWLLVLLEKGFVIECGEWILMWIYLGLIGVWERGRLWWELSGENNKVEEFYCGSLFFSGGLDNRKVWEWDF